MSKKKRAKVRVVQPLEASPAPVSAVSPVRRGQIKWPVLLAVADPLSILGLYIYLLAHSWLRWMDPMVDFPRDLYLAWRVSEGDLLYKTLANWYGPLAQLVEGSAFKLFGVGIDTIIWSNIALTAVVVILLRDLFQTLGNRLSGWLAAVVFLAVFAFGHYMANANYNFIAPYVAQSTYSFVGLVVVLWSLVHHLKSERSWWLGLTGLGLAVVGVAAALMMVRIFLNGRIYHFGFFMMPLAAIWLVHLMVVEAAQRALDGQRNNHLLPIAFTGLVLVGVYATAQTSLGVYAIKNFEVGEGRDHFYTYELKVFYNGQLLKDAMKAFKLATPHWPFSRRASRLTTICAFGRHWPRWIFIHRPWPTPGQLTCWRS